LILAVKAAGFQSIRVPCAWSGYIINKTTYEIGPAWLARVKEVVGYIVDARMYAIINIHWDGGWLEEHPTRPYQYANNKKLAAIWRQIATILEPFDEHVLFAGANEVHEGYGDPPADVVEVQQSYMQTFVTTVRATGGNNANRNLVVQAFGANIGYAVQYLTMPSDKVANRLFAEVHYYDPWDFCREAGNVWLWGRNFAGQDHLSAWGQEDYLEERMSQMRIHFVDKGIPVILGEYGVSYRTTLPEEDLAKHIVARCYFLNYIAKVAVRNGIVPCYWDNGMTGDKGCGLFDRRTNTQKYPEAIAAIIAGGLR
jgi:endoglucanase